MAQKQTPYDTIPYRNNPFRQSRPERLSAIARMFGLDSPPVDRCRVLELGCSMGGNLVVMAQDHPGSRFIGIDASSRQIADGWKRIDQLGLKNLQLKQMDILDIGDDLGEFDYIISHGVYSWVPAPVQNKILEVCQRHLAHNGVAYISYNTYPGWHVRGLVRDIMLYRGMQFSDPSTRLSQAKSLVEFVAQSTRGGDTPYTRLLQAELKAMGQMEDYYLHHDHLEENNHPVYFNEFARRLTVNGLQYLGEADFSTMISTNFAPDVAKTLQELGAHDIVQMEQYMDYVRCRYFRQTLICHSGVRLNRSLSADVVKGFYLASNATPTTAPLVLDESHVAHFQTPSGNGVNCKSPFTKLALRELQRQWPEMLTFTDLIARCKSEASREGHAADNANIDTFLAGEMLTCMASGVVEWQIAHPPFTTQIADSPATTPLARMQAVQGYGVTNLRGETVTLDEIHRQTLKHLDGSCDLSRLTESLMTSVKDGTLILYRDNDNERVTEEKEMRKLLRPALDKVLRNLAHKALLVRTASHSGTAGGR